jgi:hypothetical protein
MGNGVHHIRGRIDASLADPVDLVSIAPVAGGVSRSSLQYAIHIEARCLFHRLAKVAKPLPAINGVRMTKTPKVLVLLGERGVLRHFVAWAGADLMPLS